MKKMMMVLMMVFGLSAVFAYVPKKECAKVKRSGNVMYYEKTEPYKSLIWMEKATSPEPNGLDITLTKSFNESNGTNISPEEFTISRWLEYAESSITWAVTCLAFVTEENYLTLTKEEMLAKMNVFKAENK